MSMNSVREQLTRKLQDKEYRDSFAAEQVFSHLPLKIRSLRENRHLSQKELGDKAGVAQAWVSKLEDPNYGKLTISTLLRLASAFDVGLEVDFVPFSRVLDRALKLSPESFQVPSFAADQGLLLNHERSQSSIRRAVVSTLMLRAPGYRTLPAHRAGLGCAVKEIARFGSRECRHIRQFFPARKLGGEYSAGGASRVIERQSRQAA